jgi:hypothetical protein
MLPLPNGCTEAVVMYLLFRHHSVHWPSSLRRAPALDGVAHLYFLFAIQQPTCFLKHLGFPNWPLQVEGYREAALFNYPLNFIRPFH